LLDDAFEFSAALDGAGAPLALTAAALHRGLDAARAAVDAVLARHESDADLAGAAAVNLLMLVGTVLGGWQLARAAAAAQAGGSGDSEWLGAKIVTAEFYAEHVMPRCSAYLAAIEAGSRSVMGLSAEQFSR
jgi:hypothetical protein